MTESGTGSEFAAPTVTVIVSSSNRTGDPLSVTLTLKVNVPVTAGVQVKEPVVELIAAPDGGVIKEKVLVWPASTSVAKAVNFSCVPFGTDLLPIGASTGASFTEVILIVTHAGTEARQPTFVVKAKESFPE